MFRKNIIANVLGRTWGVISVYLFVPLYIKFLGIEAFGLVGFFSTLAGVLAFADMGFTATLNREIARLNVRKDSIDEMRDLLRTYELTYLCISFALAITIWIAAPLIVTDWLRANQMHGEEITAAIRLMGFAISFQLPSGMYTGGLMGLQQQVRANHLQIVWGLYRGFGTVLVLWLISPTIEAFAFSQLISNAIFCVMARRSMWRSLSFGLTQPDAHFRWQVFRNTWRYGAGMTAMALVTTLLTQLDKLAVSKMLTLEMLGFYTLAGALAAVPLMLASPIALAVFPRFTELVTTGERVEFVRLYHRTCELVAVVIIPAGLTMIFFSGDFIRAWTGMALTAQRTELVASLLLGGQLMQAITTIPFYVALAHGDVKLNLKIGIVSVLLVTPLLIYLIRQFGIVGAGLSWLIMNVCTLPPYMYFLHQRFLHGELKQWLRRGLGYPLLTAFPCVLLGRWLAPHADSRMLTFILIGLVMFVSVTVTASTVPALRSKFVEQARKLISSFTPQKH